MPIHLSREEARRFLATYHFSSTTVNAVFERLGTIQYDPLNPVGRNIDLVLQSRVPGYRVDDWQRYAYHDRLVYDAWDKQACLVPTGQWSMRAPIRSVYQAWHDRTVVASYPGAVEAALAEIDKRGPLSSLEFGDRERIEDGNAWLGPTRIKRILRALWIEGRLVTHHRQGVRHYYDRPERVIPARYLAEPAPSLLEYHRWIVLQRHRAAGLLRRSSHASIWSACGDARARDEALHHLTETGELAEVKIGNTLTIYHAPVSALNRLDSEFQDREMRFVAPLDSLLWDRAGARKIFDFDYVWEVYRPVAERRWGYYVIPVFYQDRFVARFDSRLEKATWNVINWWWEGGRPTSVEAMDALRLAARRFTRYLGAEGVRVSAGVDALTRHALTG